MELIPVGLGAKLQARALEVEQERLDSLCASRVEKLTAENERLSLALKKVVELLSSSRYAAHRVALDALLFNELEATK